MRIKPVLIPLISILIFVIGRPLFAWEYDKLAEVGYFFIPDTDLKDEDGEIQMNSVQARAMGPVRLTESVLLLVGFEYQGLFVGYRDMPFTYFAPDGTRFTEKDLPEDLHGLDYILGVAVELNEQWSTYAEFRPGLHSDLKDVEGDDIYYQGGGFVSWALSGDLSLSLGLFYDDAFGKPLLFPLAGIQWRIDDQLALDAFLPDYLVFSYRASPWFAFGVQGKLRGHQFRLSEKLPWKDTVLEYSQVMIGPFIDFNITEYLVLRLEGGMAAIREFEFREDDSSVELYDGDIEERGYFSVSVAIVPGSR